jgi:hypothetical protein
MYLRIRMIKHDEEETLPFEKKVRGNRKEWHHNFLRW